MANTISPSMGLPIPDVGTQPGPDYATDVNTSLTIIDTHTHIAGSGNPITPDAISINTSLTFSDNFAVDLAGMTMTAQSITPDNQTLYVNGVDLYYTDGLGNNIRMTQSGGIVGSPGSISGLASPASATYVSGSQTFVWQSGTSIAANMDAGSLLLRNLSPNSTYALTLAPPSGLAANYTVTLPPIPAATAFVTMANSGVLAGSIPIASGITQSNMAANSIGTSQIIDASVSEAKIIDGAVTANKIQAGAVTNPKLGALSVSNDKIDNLTITGAKIAAATLSSAKMSTQTVSSSSIATFTTGSTSFVDVTGGSVTISCSGTRTVLIMLTGYNGSIPAISETVANAAVAQILVDGVFLSTLGALTSSYTTSYTPSAGSHTIKLQLKSLTGNNVSVSNFLLLAIEL